MRMFVNTRLGARLVVEGVLSNLAFQRSRLPLAWDHMHAVLEQSASRPVRRLASDFPPGLVKAKQTPVVNLFNSFFYRRTETEGQALQILGDNLHQLTSITGLMLYFDLWKELVTGHWNDLHGALFHSARLATLETSDKGPLREVLDDKIDAESMSTMGIELQPAMKTAMVAPLIEFARERSGADTKIAVLSSERSQTDWIVVSLLRLYSLLDVARWDNFAKGLRPITVFGVPPKLNELRQLDTTGPWCVIDASCGFVNDNEWNSLIKFLEPALQIGLGRTTELHHYPVAARLQDLGLNPAAEPEPGPRIAITGTPQPKLKPVRRPRTGEKRRVKAAPTPVPPARPVTVPEPQSEPVPATQAAVIPAAETQPVPEVKPVSTPEPKAESIAIPESALRSFSEAGPESPSAPATKVSRPARTGSRYTTAIIDQELGHRSFLVAAHKLDSEIERTLNQGGDLEAQRASLRTKLELEARRHYNDNRPTGRRAVLFLSALMQDQTGHPEVLALLRRLGLKN